MRAAALAMLALATLLTGCHKSDSDEVDTPQGDKGQGRYTGIGIYSPGRLWRQLAQPAPAKDSAAPKPKDPAAARIDDDEEIIVVIDSHTGEVRQCGNHSGYCVAMNPWTGVAPTLPALLKKHGAELEAETRAESERVEAQATRSHRAR